MVRHTRESGAKSRSGQAEKKPAAKPERIAKALARAGVASRREVERLVGLGKVAVNGRVLDSPAVLVQRSDIITVDGKVVNEPEATRVWRYHKPVGLLTSHRDPEGRPTVFENLPEGLPRVISVGRLDINSEGLLLLTNDGDLARALELPSNAWTRVYRARAHGHVTQAKLDTLKDGITVDGVHYGSIEAKLDKAQEKEGGPSNLWITVTVTEGKNREVRKVLEAVGMKVNRLIRLAYGPFLLGALESGAAEEIGPRVIREQLADHIAPDMLPTGDRVVGPPSKPARRLPANAIADPRRKPSKVRALAERDEKATSARPKPVVEHGPARPERTFKPRTGPGGAPKPYRPRGEHGDNARSERPQGDRPQRGRPERDKSERPYNRPRPERAEGAGSGRTFKPRAERSEGGERTFRPRTDRAEGGERTFKPRGERPEGGDRGGYKGGPRPGGKPGGRPSGPRPGGKPGARGPAREGDGERTFRPRTDRAEGSGDRPPFKGGPRSGGKPAGKDGFKPRSSGFKPGGRGAKPGGGGGPGGRPSGGRPAGGGPRKPRG